jgi:hypothetical protein
MLLSGFPDLCGKPLKKKGLVGQKGKGDSEETPLPFLVCDLNLSFMECDNLFDDRKPEPHAFLPVRALPEPAEFFEEGLLFFGGNPDPGIGDA